MRTNCLNDFHNAEKLRLLKHNLEDRKEKTLYSHFDIDPFTQSRYENVKKLYNYIREELLSMKSFLEVKQRKQTQTDSDFVPLNAIFERIKLIEMNINDHNRRLQKTFDRLKSTKQGKELFHTYNSKSTKLFNKALMDKSLNESRDQQVDELEDKISQMRLKNQSMVAVENEPVEKIREIIMKQNKFYTQLYDVLRRRKQIPNQTKNFDRLDLFDSKFDEPSETEQLVLPDTSFLTLQTSQSPNVSQTASSHVEPKPTLGIQTQPKSAGKLPQVGQAQQPVIQPAPKAAPIIFNPAQTQSTQIAQNILMPPLAGSALPQSVSLQVSTPKDKSTPSPQLVKDQTPPNAFITQSVSNQLLTTATSTPSATASQPSLSSTSFAFNLQSSPFTNLPLSNQPSQQQKQQQPKSLFSFNTMPQQQQTPPISQTTSTESIKQHQQTLPQPKEKNEEKAQIPSTSSMPTLQIGFAGDSSKISLNIPTSTTQTPLSSTSTLAEKDKGTKPVDKQDEPNPATVVQELPKTKPEEKKKEETPAEKVEPKPLLFNSNQIQGSEKSLFGIQPGNSLSDSSFTFGFAQQKTQQPKGTETQAKPEDNKKDEKVEEKTDTTKPTLFNSGQLINSTSDKKETEKQTSATTSFSFGVIPSALASSSSSTFSSGAGQPKVEAPKEPTTEPPKEPSVVQISTPLSKQTASPLPSSGFSSLSKTVFPSTESKETAQTNTKPDEAKTSQSATKPQTNLFSGFGQREQSNQATTGSIFGAQNKTQEPATQQ